jgi:RNA polymerase sigma-70 factor (ECF subfamily)
MATCVMTSMAPTMTPATKPVEKEARWEKPEGNLIQRAQGGDEQAFAELFQLHKKRVYSVCLLMTKDVAEAEDLTQEAFLQVFRTIGTFRGDSAFSTWLYRIAVNTVLMKLRRQKSKVTFSLSEPVSPDSPNLAHDLGERDPRLSGTIDRIALLRAIEALPEGCRTVFMLHEVEGYQHHEIASLLDCSIGNSKSQLHKAKLKMRDLLFPKRRILRRRSPALLVARDQTVNTMLNVNAGATEITGLLPALFTPMVAERRL